MLGPFSLDWCGVDWSDWFPIVKRRKLKEISRGPGVYRVRVAGQPEMAYIGYSASSLRKHLSSLTKLTLGDQVPWGERHTASLALWTHRKGNELDYEFSASAAELDERQLKARWCHLLWQYRLWKRESPFGNFARLHPEYGDVHMDGTGTEGRRISEVEAVADLMSLPPLESLGEPSDDYWMRLMWSSGAPDDSEEGLPEQPGLFKVLDEGGQLLYVGESENLAEWSEKESRFPGARISYSLLPDIRSRRQRLELSTDLIGAFHATSKGCPKLQFTASDG